MPGKDLDFISLAQFQQPINCCNVTSLAYAFSALGFPTTVDEIFYATRLPIASVLDDGMTLAETYDTCGLYIKNTGVPMSVRMLCFDTPGTTYETFVKELERASRDPSDIHIFNFSVSIAHAVPGIGGGHFSLMADYNSETQELTIADTNPKKYTRYWKCPAKRMYDACVDKDSSSTRPRGLLVIRKLETVTAAATVPTAAAGKPASAPAVVYSQPLAAPEKPAS
ncbi:MAG TPA: phytochelatin synthase family protein [Kofleriaceae bacterium]|nr:phytochelatin synthase family protein [Kofleriaceae bacterium]